jgi:nucleoside 2-deoxyribosyltransferase
MNPSLCYYLAGPMKGYADHNFPAFEAALRQLQSEGFTCISPHELNPPRPEGLTDEQWYAICMHTDFQVILEHCSGIVLLPGWRTSTGAKAELVVATLCQYPVYDYETREQLNLACVVTVLP